VPSTHIIRRQFLDVELVGSESDGLALRRRLTDLCQERLMPALEAVLDRLSAANEHWTLDSLEIDAGAFDLETLERGLVDQVSQELERRLKAWAVRAGQRAAGGQPRANAAEAERRHGQGPADVRMDSPEPGERRTEAQATADALVHFLRTGLLPWWFQLPSGQTLEDAVRASLSAADHASARFSQTMTAVLSSPSARTRLVRQFSADFLARVLVHISASRLAAVREILATLERQAPVPESRDRLRVLVWQAAFAIAREHPSAGALVAAAIAEASAPSAEPLKPALLDLAARLWPEVRAFREALRPEAVPMRTDRSAPQSQIDLDEGVFVGCAGVVLLHPFLPRLFEALGIATDDALVQPDRALGLLHFLATGQPIAPEYDLLLPKLLCNLPLDLPAPAPAVLSAAEMDEAIALLSAVVGHWTALGDISVDGLRGSFLVRPGKLSRRGDGSDLLQVEPRSYDILLDRLPWGIGMLQLPWMKKILWVEWRM